MVELNNSIKTLKRGKSYDPDTLNNVYNEEKIPSEWQEAEIIRIYKGRGVKGKCSNEREITLSSNMGKYLKELSTIE